MNDILIQLAKKAADEWKGDQAYHQASELIYLLIEDIEKQNTPPANPPLTLDELRDAMEQGTAVYIAKPSGETIMIEQTYAPCVLDTTWVAGIDKPQIVAIYGRNLSFAESEYGITWLAYRHNPGRESEK